MQKLKRFVKDELQYLSEVYKHPSENEFLLFHMAKLTEELGELSESVLLHIGKGQRKEKVEKFSEEDLQGEIADVIIVTAQIAETAGIDIEDALQKKIKQIKNRHGSHTCK